MKLLQLLIISVSWVFTAPAIAQENIPLKKASMDKVFQSCKTYTQKTAMPPSIYMTGRNVTLLRFANCMGYRHMLVVVWNGDSSELEKTFARLIVLHYAAFESDRDKSTSRYKTQFIDIKSKSKTVDKVTVKINFIFYNYLPLKVK